MAGLDQATVRAAERSHPTIVEAGSRRENPAFAGIEELSRLHDEPLPLEPPMSAQERSISVDDLPGLRRWVASAAAAHGHLVRPSTTSRSP